MSRSTLLVCVCMAVLLSLVNGAPVGSLEPLQQKQTPAQNAAAIAAVAAQVKANSQKIKYYNIRNLDVNPNGEKKNRGQFAKKPAVAALSPWSQGVTAAWEGNAVKAAAAIPGPFKLGSGSAGQRYGDLTTLAVAGQCGFLVNGWSMKGECRKYEYNCESYTTRTDGARQYICRSITGSNASRVPNPDPKPDSNLPTPAPAAAPKPVFVDRCGNRCNFPRECCRLTGQTSDYYQCMNC